jgi:acyl carrier protein phosphodiesterase
VNILFHMFLSGNDHELLVGNFMGDFVKGPLGDSYPPRIRQGLILHRKIDSFAQQDASFQASRLRLPSHYGLYRGVLVDLFYDHFLAKEWSRFSDRQLPAYLSWARNIVERYRPIMSKQLQDFIPVIFDELLPSYEKVTGIESALYRMSRRVKRANPLAEGGAELTNYYEELETDFEQFIVAAQNFSTGLI